MNDALSFERSQKIVFYLIYQKSICDFNINFDCNQAIKIHHWRFVL